jgi:hypothetical protein
VASQKNQTQADTRAATATTELRPQALIRMFIQIFPALRFSVRAIFLETLHLMSLFHCRIWALLWLAGTLLAVVVGGKWMVLRS